MKKNRIKYTGRVLECSDPNFDWSLYENGYEGGSSLKINSSIKSKGKDKIFCHESYAKDLYAMVDNWFNGRNISAKDDIKGTVYDIYDVRAISDHEISVDSNCGMSAVIDMNKEKEYLNIFDCSSPKEFTQKLSTSESFKKSIIESGLNGKVVENGRVSLWDGHLSKIENEFMTQILHPETINCAYKAKIENINGGGFIVNILGIQCFLPGSLAAAGILTDFESMLGKTVPVIVVNYISKSNCFVVSYKKYLEMILPQKIEAELSVGQEVAVKVTGSSKNGLFCQIKELRHSYLL